MDNHKGMVGSMAGKDIHMEKEVGDNILEHEQEGRSMADSNWDKHKAVAAGMEAMLVVDMDYFVLHQEVVGDSEEHEA